MGFCEQDEGSESSNRMKWEQLLNADNPHKLVYSLQIIESLSRPPKYVRRFVTVSGSMYFHFNVIFKIILPLKSLFHG
jgi:hypothetical protein